jgi:hypothetical protein
MPKSENSHPPRAPPRRPSTIFMMMPKPPPFINLPAQKPAKQPKRSEMIIPIILMFNWFDAAKIINYFETTKKITHFLLSAKILDVLERELSVVIMLCCYKLII